jgi:hypothetical protein
MLCATTVERTVHQLQLSQAHDGINAFTPAEVCGAAWLAEVACVSRCIRALCVTLHLNTVLFCSDCLPVSVSLPTAEARGV